MVAPRGGMLGDIPVQRTSQTASSVEFDAAIALVASPDAPTQRLLDELFRQGKAIGATGDGESALGSARIDPGAAGIVVAGADEVVSGIIGLLGSHRVWERLAGKEATVSA